MMPIRKNDPLRDSRPFYSAGNHGNTLLGIWTGAEYTEADRSMCEERG